MDLSTAQREGVASDHPRLRIVACAGSGKTEVLARRVVRLLLGGALPESIIAFTFTNKAASELKARIEARAGEADAAYAELPPPSRGLFVGTTHGWALSALRAAGGLYGAVDTFTEEQEWTLLYRMGRRLGVVGLYEEAIRGSSHKVTTAAAVTRFLRTLEVVHNEGISSAILAREAPTFKAVMDRYERLLGDMRVMPFRSMITHAVQELAPGGRLFASLGQGVQHVLVDEAQDFNRAQFALLDSFRALGATVAIVGDDDQAIYQWRGGNVSLFSDFNAVCTVRLSENRRCRPQIVRLAGEVAARLPRRIAKELGMARDEARVGAVELMMLGTAVDEARAIAGRIRKLIADGHLPSRIAVLYRSVRTSAEPLIQALTAAGVPVAVVGKTSLLAQPTMLFLARIFVFWAGGSWYRENEREVVTRDMLVKSAMTVCGLSAAAADAVVARVEVLGTTLSRSWIKDIVETYDDLLALLALPNVDRSAGEELALGRMSELLAGFQHAARRAVPERFYRDLTGDDAAEAIEDSTLQEAPARAATTSFRTASPPGAVFLSRLRAYLEEFASRSAEVSSEDDPEVAGAVRVMTIHQAKGLEFSVVFVPSLIERRFPSSLTGRPQVWLIPESLFDRRRYEGTEEDEARLLYVALTRARELLVLSWFERHPSGQSTSPSRFVGTHMGRGLQSAATPGALRVEPEPNQDASPLQLELDFSALWNYRACGYRYWLGRVCGFQPILDTALGFGRALHHIMAEWARAAMAGRMPSAADLPGVLDAHLYLPMAGPVPRTRLREAARHRLAGYLTRYGSELARAAAVEVPFEVPLSSVGASARLRGRVDLLVRPAGSSDPCVVDILDFKTSSGTQPQARYENQLRLYGAALRKLGFTPHALYIHDLGGHGRRLRVADDRGARAAFEQQLAESAGGIAAARFEPSPSPETCADCDYRRFCPYRATAR